MPAVPWQSMKTTYHTISAKLASHMRLCNDIFKKKVEWLHGQALGFGSEFYTTTRYYSHPSQRFESLQLLLYTAGFPCTPFSLLHWNSRVLEDQHARQFFTTVSNIKTIQPVVARMHLTMIDCRSED